MFKKGDKVRLVHGEKDPSKGWSMDCTDEVGLIFTVERATNFALSFEENFKWYSKERFEKVEEKMVEEVEKSEAKKGSIVIKDISTMCLSDSYPLEDQ